jgi:UDP-N-acetylglucosamine acyltransferase
MSIHPTAIVADGADLGVDVEIGPYCVVGANVRLADRCRLVSHVSVDGHTSLGEACTVYPFSSVGSLTQDLKYAGGAPRLEIGDRTTIRESCTLNVATADGDATVVGSDCLLMAYTHVAHDCRLGDHIILANCGTLAGHVVMEDYAILGGLSGIHQFVRVGRHAIIGGCTKITQDIPPFMMADGNPAEVRGVNAVGLKRRGVAAETIKAVKGWHKTIYREGLTLKKALAKIESDSPPSEEREQFIGFLKSSERGITR